MRAAWTLDEFLNSTLKVIVVTGGASGIGAAVATRFARDDYQVCGPACATRFVRRTHVTDAACEPFVHQPPVHPLYCPSTHPQVVIADLDEAKGKALAAEIHGCFVRTDVSQEAEVEALVDFCVERFGGPSVHRGTVHRGAAL